ncbi:MAG: hypothetical protein EB832_00185 [Thaumarchaeota archaeon S14]|nr:hypothetical protein [Nitrososphaerota archaeon]RNJ74301.1 MAG: hypothetical protein EB832_00185 [Thaumarchaeota archaeon S14]
MRTSQSPAQAGARRAGARCIGRMLPSALPEEPATRPTPALSAEGAARRGTLFRLVNHMHRTGILGGDGTLDRLEAQNALQKQAYVAQRLGVPLGYAFEFMDNGAFSAGLAADIYYRMCAAGGTEPFAGDPASSGAFARLVGGMGAYWLQVTTFALDGRHAGESRGEFVDRVRRTNPEYEKAMAGQVFDHVGDCLAGTGGMAP